MTLLRSILHRAARCAIAIASFGCDQVLGLEEAHVDPTVQAPADANGGATNVAESSTGGTAQTTSSLGERAAASGEGGADPQL